MPASRGAHARIEYTMRSCTTAQRRVLKLCTDSFSRFCANCRAKDLSQFFQETSDFIAKARKSGGVLVHCWAGVSCDAGLVGARARAYAHV